MISLLYRILQLQSRPKPLTPPVILNKQIDELKEDKEKEISIEPVVYQETDTPEIKEEIKEEQTIFNLSESVLKALQEKDIGGSGYVTIKELTSALVSTNIKVLKNFLTHDVQFL